MMACYALAQLLSSRRARRLCSPLVLAARGRTSLQRQATPPPPPLCATSGRCVQANIFCIFLWCGVDA